MLDSSGLMLSSYWTHLCSCWAHVELILTHVGLMLGSCWAHVGLMLGSCWAPHVSASAILWSLQQLRTGRSLVFSDQSVFVEVGKESTTPGSDFEGRLFGRLRLLSWSCGIWEPQHCKEHPGKRLVRAIYVGPHGANGPGCRVFCSLG